MHVHGQNVLNIFVLKNRRKMLTLDSCAGFIVTVGASMSFAPWSVCCYSFFFFFLISTPPIPWYLNRTGEMRVYYKLHLWLTHRGSQATGVTEGTVGVLSQWKSDTTFRSTLGGGRNLRKLRKSVLNVVILLFLLSYYDYDMKNRNIF